MMSSTAAAATTSWSAALGTTPSKAVAAMMSSTAGPATTCSRATQVATLSTAEPTGTYGSRGRPRTRLRMPGSGSTAATTTDRGDRAAGRRGRHHDLATQGPRCRARAGRRRDDRRRQLAPASSRPDRGGGRRADHRRDDRSDAHLGPRQPAGRGPRPSRRHARARRRGRSGGVHARGGRARLRAGGLGADGGADPGLRRRPEDRAVARGTQGAGRQAGQPAGPAGRRG